MIQGQQPPAIDLDRLRTDLAEARERVRDLEQLIILAERWYGRGQSTNAPKPNDAPKDKPTTLPTPTPVLPAEGPFAGMGARDAAVQLLKTTGTVWKVDPATQELLKLGWRTNSSEPETVVRSAMMRDKRIERVAPGRFRYREPNGLAGEGHQQRSEVAELEPQPDGEVVSTNGDGSERVLDRP
jgi:hypothetical protein